MKKTIFLFLALVVIAIFQGFYYYAALPDKLASHFGANGIPDGWQSKNAFYATYYGVMFLLVLSFLSMPLMVRIIPSSMLNLPNKTYWLDPSRRTVALENYIRFMLISGMATVIFMMSVVQLVFNMNLQGQSRLPSVFWSLFIVYVSFVILQTVIFYRRFRVPKA